VFGVLFYSFLVGAQLHRDEVENGPKTPEHGGEDWRNTVFIPRTVPQTLENGTVPVHAQQGYTNPNMGGTMPVKVVSANNGQYNHAYAGGNKCH